MSQAAAATKPETPASPPPAAPEAAAPAQKAAPAGPKKKLNIRRFQEADIWQSRYAVQAEKGTTIEDLLDRDYWADVAAKLRPMTKICVMEENHLFYVELVVFEIGMAWAQVEIFGAPIMIDAAKRVASPAHDYEVFDGGLFNKWSIRRRSDGRVVKGDSTLHTPEAAHQWLREYMRANKIAP